MNFKSFGKIAAVSAIAMATALHATDVMSAAYVIGTDVPVQFNAVVDNTIDVDVAPGTFGTIAAHRGVAGDISTAILLPQAAGAVVDSHSTGMGTSKTSLIVGDDTSVANGALVTITQTFQNEDMFITFDNCANLVNGTEAFTLTAISTNIGAGTAHTCGAGFSTPIAVVTTGAGAIAPFYVGATIATTDTTPGPYTSGTYVGSVDMQVIY